MQFIDEHRRSVSDGTVDGAAAGVAVPTTAKALCDFGDIDGAFAPKVEAEAIPVRKLAKEDGRTHTEDADEVVDDAFAVLDDRVGAFHVVEGDVGPRDFAVDFEVGESNAEKANLTLRMREVDGLGDAGGVCATLEQMLGEAEGEGVGRGEGEGAGVSEYGRVETAGHFSGDLFSGGDRELIDHDADGAGCGVDPVEVCEAATTLMVIDIDDHACLDLVEAGALDGVTLEQDSDVRELGGLLGNDALDAGKTSIHSGDAVGEGYRDALPHGLDQMHEAKRRTDRVAIRAGVRRDEKALVVADNPKDSGNSVSAHHGLAVALLCGSRRLALYLFAVLPGAAQDLIHACADLLGTIDSEGELGHMTDAHTLTNLGTNVVARGDEAVEGALFSFLVTVYGDEDTGALAAWREHNLGDVAWRDARVREFALQHGGNLLAEGAGDPITVMLSCSLLWHR